MFKVVAERRKRRTWSSRTVAASITFHLLLAAGLVTAAETHEPERVGILVDIGPVPPEPPKVVRADPPPQPKQDEAPVVKGHTLQLPAPEAVPPTLPPPDLTAPPATPADYNGEGAIGNKIGPPDPNAGHTPVPPQGTDSVFKRWGAPIEVELADVKPELANRRQAETLLQRNYPAFMRDAGVTGHTTVQLIIDAEGNVEPGSVIVQESTNDAFKDATVRTVERFRFKPAQYRGRAVSVLVTLPIEWTLQN